MEINAKRLEQQLRNFRRAFDAYDHNEPFARFLTRFFKENKQMGSSDRRMTSRFCYNLFRLGKALLHIPLIDRLVVAEFLCEAESALVSLHQPDWAVHSTASLAEKIAFLEQQGYMLQQALFPFSPPLSGGLDLQRFAVSHLIQPDLFIRVPAQHKAVLERELSKNDIAFETLSDNAYRLNNGSKLQQLKKLAGLYEVQDLSSQHSLDGLDITAGEKWWDACAGSGGKALLLLDHFPHIDLLVSDIRLSILRNLDERFEKAQVRMRYRKKVLDLTQNVDTQMEGDTFDGIILDAPCSGSGTWGRTPEMLSQFDETRLQHFVALQQQIVRNTVPHLKSGGTLVYITCSVFEAENEQMLHYMEDACGLVLETAELIKGYDRKSDSMFTARMRKK